MQLPAGSHVRETVWRISFTVILGLAAKAALQAAPVIISQPESFDVAPGDPAGFRVVTSTALPNEYHWFHQGKEVSATTGDLFFIPSATSADAGDYTVTISDSTGSITSRTVTLNVAPYENPLDVNFSPGPFTGIIYSVAALAPDETLIVYREANSDYGISIVLERRDAKGAVLVTLLAGADLAALGRIVSLHVLPGGQIMAASETSEGTVRVTLLNSSGSIDPTYLLRTASPPEKFIGWQHDEAICVVAGSLTRIAADGTTDAGFKAPTLAGASFLYIDPQSRLYGLVDQTVIRLRPDGSADETFHSIPVTVENTLEGIATLSDGRLILASAEAQARNSTYGPSIIKYNIHFNRFAADGSEGELLPASYSYLSLERFYLTMVPLGGARLLLAGSFTELGLFERHGVAILDAQGAVDPNFALLDHGGELTSTTDALLYPDGARALLVGTISSQGGDSFRPLARVKLNTTRAPLPPRLLRADSLAGQLPAGDDWPLRLFVVGHGPFVLDHAGGSGVFTPPEVSVPDVQPGPALGQTLRIRTPAGLTDPFQLNLMVIDSPPRFNQAPQNVTASPGTTVYFDVTARGNEGIIFQWYKDGLPLSGENNPVLRIENATTASAGGYSVLAKNSVGQTWSQQGTLKIGQTARLANISVRALAGTGSKTLIVGYVIEGAGGLRLLETALGPELAAYGVSHPMPDPALRIGEQEVESSPNLAPQFPPTSDFFRLTGARPIDFLSKSVQLFQEGVQRGAHTFLVDANNREPGVVLAEVYDADNSSTRIVNLSARAFVGNGENIAIPGFIIRGDTPLRVVIRAVGPGLSAFGVAEVLDDPMIEVVNNAGLTIARNDDWQQQTDVPSLLDATSRAGAFPLANSSKDAAVDLTLPPGGYTALVRGKNGATGVALLEIYEVRGQ